ncbi:MAG: META domain-containing protein [Caldilineaceae bacterium]
MVSNCLGNTTASVPVLTDSPVTLSFDADGQVHGNGGCNSYRGEYTIENALTFVTLLW